MTANPADDGREEVEAAADAGAGLLDGGLNLRQPGAGRLDALPRLLDAAGGLRQRGGERR